MNDSVPRVDGWMDGRMTPRAEHVVAVTAVSQVLTRVGGF